MGDECDAGVTAAALSRADSKDSGMGGIVSQFAARASLWRPERPDQGVPDFPRGLEHVRIQSGDTDKYHFLHDPAIAVHGERLFAAWYNCPEGEIEGESLIRGRDSRDGGRTWSALQTVANDADSQGIHYVPVQLLSLEGRLRAFVGRMTGHDLIVACSIFHYDEPQDRWLFAGDVADRFLPNCQPIKMTDGNWIMAGRIAERLGEKPLIPAVAISSGDRLSEPWRVVSLQREAFAPGECPETTLWAEGAELIAVTRNCREPRPFFYTSRDHGRTWQAAGQTDFSAVTSKMYAGRLTTGQYYLVYNQPLPGDKDGHDRGRLVVAVSRPGEFAWSRIWKVRERGVPGHPEAAHYPCAIEHEGRLLIIYTARCGVPRQCEMAAIPLKSLEW